VASALNNLAWMFALKDGDKSQALPLITHAVELEGERPDILDTRALVHMEMGHADLAVRDIENSNAVAPSAVKYFHLARAYQMQGRRDDSIVALEKAKEMGLTLEGLHPLERGAFRKLTEDLARR
jgi:tetratricopeptide (TPR) repeat protein